MEILYVYVFIDWLSRMVINPLQSHDGSRLVVQAMSVAYNPNQVPECRRTWG